jgi:ketosteroid isomerase-like protein
MLLVVCVVVLPVMGAAGQASSGRAEIETFNQKFIDAHLRMDTPAVLLMWAEDGVSLLPEMAPLVASRRSASLWKMW